MYKFTVLPNIGDHYHKSIEEMILDFIWNKRKPKMKAILQGLKDQGGAGLVNLRSREEALKGQWVWFVESDPIIQALANHFIKSSLGSTIWNVQLNEEHAMQLYPGNEFWHQVFCTWCKINYEELIGKNEVLNELLWYNSNILIESTPVLYQKWLKAGVQSIQHIFENNSWISYERFEQRYNLQVPITEFYGILSAIPTQWKLWLKEGIEDEPRKKCIQRMRDTPRKVNVLYRNICNNSELVYAVWLKTFYELNRNLEYEEFVDAIVSSSKITISEKLRSFHYRFIMNSLITNIHLKHYGIKETNLCTFCEKMPETSRHLFYECEKVKPIWNFFETKMKLPLLTYKQIYLNMLCKNPKDVENCILLIIKQYIYATRCLNQRISINSCTNAINLYALIEENIAKSRNKIELHKNKWKLSRDKAMNARHGTQITHGCSF